MNMWEKMLSQRQGNVKYIYIYIYIYISADSLTRQRKMQKAHAKCMYACVVGEYAHAEKLKENMCLFAFKKRDVVSRNDSAELRISLFFSPIFTHANTAGCLSRMKTGLATPTAATAAGRRLNVFNNKAFLLDRQR